uniref:Uncharacterized protein n=1 Tax=Haemonchus contortus TaxID=6289 RepID=W6N9N7_HAECO
MLYSRGRIPASTAARGHFSKIRRPPTRPRSFKRGARANSPTSSRQKNGRRRPDLNPMDHNLWSYLESKACATPHPNLDFLKAALIREWDEIDDVLLRPVVDAFPKRLRAVIRAKGGRIKK